MKSETTNRIAIIDLGTNTFNLIIVEVNADKTYHTLYKNKISVKLGESGITKGLIAPKAFKRGIDALKDFNEQLQKYNVTTVYALGTSAIRDASNGKLFLEEIKKETGIIVQAISGEREAELIYYGVREAAKMTNEFSLIMDIGGGSTEFIIANKDEILWKHSFLLGAARLIELFDINDPILDHELNTLDSHLSTELQPLFDAINKYPITELIGASGSFDSFAEMIVCHLYSSESTNNETEYTFNLNDFETIHQFILKSTKAERSSIKGLVAMRVDMIVISTILVKFILSRFKIKRMRLSAYSLKEGVLYEMLNKNIE